MKTPQRTSAEIADGSDALHGAHVAGRYYNGQFTALYALASTGSLELYPGEGLSRIRREVAEAINTADQEAALAEGEWFDALEARDFENLHALHFATLEARDEAEALRAFAEWLAEADRDGGTL